MEHNLGLCTSKFGRKHTVRATLGKEVSGCMPAEQKYF
jgi:hypothetical protein